MSASEGPSDGKWRNGLAEHFERKAQRGCITLAKLKFYEDWRGNYDRVNTDALRRVMTDDEWRVIDKLTDDALLVTKGLVSAEYIQQHKERLAFACDSESTAREVDRIAVKVNTPGLFEKVGCMTWLVLWMLLIATLQIWL